MVDRHVCVKVMKDPGWSNGEPPVEEDGVVRTRVDWSSRSPSGAVVETVAVAADREPTDLAPLYERVDPDALDSLLRANGSATDRDGVSVSFVYSNHLVSADATGEVVVRPVESGE